MNTAKCMHCGLVAFARDVTCRRCGRRIGAPLEQQTTFQSGGQSLDRARAYTIPQPATAVYPSAWSGGIWRDGKVLVFEKCAILPDRCIRCNDLAYGVRVIKSKWWQHRAYALLILVTFGLYMLIALLVHKRADLSLGFCERHKSERTKWVAAGWLLFPLSVMTLMAGFFLQQAAIVFIGLGLVAAAAIAGTVGGNYIKVKKIDDHYVWLKNIHPDYLNQFPPM